MSNPVLLRDKTVVTRVSHGCAWCGELIPAPSTVKYRKYTWDDGIANEWWHDECWKALLNADVEDVEEGYIAGDHKRGSTVNINS